MNSTICPVCRQEAKTAPHNSDGYEFICGECGPFRITGSAYATLSNWEDIEGRIQALSEAKLKAERSAEGRLPLITSAYFL